MRPGTAEVSYGMRASAHVLHLVRMRHLVGFCVDRTLEFTDGRAECQRVTGKTQEPTFYTLGGRQPRRYRQHGLVPEQLVQEGQGRLATAGDAKPRRVV